MEHDPLTLPDAVPPPRRPPVPVLAAVVPMAAGVVLWLVTGSAFTLLFAALGPLMIVASLLDGVRTRRVERRRAAQEQSEAWTAAEAELRRRHAAERRVLRRSHPDAAGCILEPPLQDAQPQHSSLAVVVGRGGVPSGLRVLGGEGERARELRQRAATLTDAPLVVPLGGGVCIRAPQPLGMAVARALVVQLCLRLGPSHLALSGSGVERLGLGGFPHARPAAPGAHEISLWVGEPERGGATAQIGVCAPGSSVPEGVSALIDCAEPSRAQLRTPTGTQPIRVEGVSRAQAQQIAARSPQGAARAVLPDRVLLAELTAQTVRTPEGDGGLAAGLGRDETDEVVLDLVEDGPHAIVTGMTGSGKSELLVTWITAMMRHRPPDRIVFVLADFKGGTAFDAFRGLPHVAAVITDLDAEGARRGVESLSAELRRREGVLAAMGARSIGEPGVALPRLVIVVDEFAALLQEHPDLGAVFTDIAARGRALGMHLILGTQRAAGVIRAALAANCPLRVSLRLSDAADSRLVLGSDQAAQIPGGSAARGWAFVRRPQDAHPRPVRVALTEPRDIRAVAERWGSAPAARSPWLPPLPALLPLDTLRAEEAGGRDAGVLLLGRADDPARQSQPAVYVRAGTDRGMAVIGGSGSGKTSVLRLLAAQCAAAVRIPADAEQAWDVVTALACSDETLPPLILGDDVDQLAAGLPADYAPALWDALEQLLRSAAARGCTMVLSASRVTGALARIVDALPSRLLLPTASRLEHLAAGGEAEQYRPGAVPGRAWLRRRLVQMAWVADPKGAQGPAASPRSADEGPPLWAPREATVAVVATGIRRISEALRAHVASHEVVALGPPPVPLPSGGARVVYVADAEGWHRQTALWQEIRTRGEVLVMAEAAPALRSLLGLRELAPYCRPGAGRAWSLQDDGDLRRVRVAGAAPGDRRRSGPR